MSQYLTRIAEYFSADGQIESVTPYGTGNINSTYLVTIRNSLKPQFILQKINTHVFPEPVLVMKNMHTVCQHINSKLQHPNWNYERQWQMPNVLFTSEGNDHYICPNGGFWRAMSFIDNAQTIDTLSNSQQAYEVGWALGSFHLFVSDIDPSELEDTLPGFHNTPAYLENYQRAAKGKAHSSPEQNFCSEFIEKRKHSVHLLEDAKNAQKIIDRPIHGDPKVSNVMMDLKAHCAVSIIDLDTVKPGLLHYDIGDCLRSGCNLKGEDYTNKGQIDFDIQLCESILKGYFSQANHLLSPYDIELIFDAVRIISFELGLRYYTDFLCSNIYFKADYPEHNLQRAITQFRLTESIESQEKKIRNITSSLV